MMHARWFRPSIWRSEGIDGAKVCYGGQTNWPLDQQRIAVSAHGPRALRHQRHSVVAKSQMHAQRLCEPANLGQQPPRQYPVAGSCSSVPGCLTLCSGAAPAVTAKLD